MPSSKAQILDCGVTGCFLLILPVDLICGLSAFPSCTGEVDEENSRNA